LIEKKGGKGNWRTMGYQQNLQIKDQLEEKRKLLYHASKLPM